MPVCTYRICCGDIDNLSCCYSTQHNKLYTSISTDSQSDKPNDHCSHVDHPTEKSDILVHHHILLISYNFKRPHVASNDMI